jgi:mRNA-degrading endonuclease toxin of MazEF toxin-antitoxin module
MNRGRRDDYHPERGDLIHMNFDPAAGHEVSGLHFAVVISTIRFSTATGLCIVVPGTRKYHPEQKIIGAQLMVALPNIPALPKQQGWVYTHQVKSVDYRDRNARFVAKIEDLDFLIEVMDRVRAFIDPDSVV